MDTRGEQRPIQKEICLYNPPLRNKDMLSKWFIHYHLRFCSKWEGWVRILESNDPCGEGPRLRLFKNLRKPAIIFRHMDLFALQDCPSRRDLLITMKPEVRPSGSIPPTERRKTHHLLYALESCPTAGSSNFPWGGGSHLRLNMKTEL